MFVDASALVAILKSEPEASKFLAALEGAEGRALTSPVARFEAVISLAIQMARARGEVHMTAEDHDMAEELVGGLLEEIGARELDVTEIIGRAARQAALTYGKVTGHPAKLNMGDCFSYAMAKSSGVRLLYKGDDFAQTDVA
ncbi:MAG: ribonuclease VapC [Limimaricola cinnabarinus]|jgi:ribonuclease VapC|uniref:type II toxin-antitoxin system VapC family toxin n=1 Tax=Limimaricola cinnabarinus TaxID=1125964 RepID=UPI0039E7018C